MYDRSDLIKRADRYASLLEESDASVVMQRIRSCPERKVNRVHTYREILMGAFLGQAGFPVRYEIQGGGKTPDWVCHTSQGTQSPILELVTFHPHSEQITLLFLALPRGKAAALFTRFTNNRRWWKLTEKPATYPRLVTEQDLPYVPAEYPEIGIILGDTFLSECLFGLHGVFDSATYLSGI